LQGLCGNRFQKAGRGRASLQVDLDEGAPMARFRKVDASSMVPQPRKPATQGRAISKEQQALIKKIKTITDESVVYEVTLAPGEKPMTVRQQLLRASKVAGVDIAVRKSASGFYIGLMTPERRSNRGRKAAKSA
jgi:hypothetical protein